MESDILRQHSFALSPLTFKNLQIPQVSVLYASVVSGDIFFSRRKDSSRNLMKNVKFLRVSFSKLFWSPRKKKEKKIEDNSVAGIRFISH